MERDIVTEKILNRSDSAEREKIRAQRQEKLREKREKEQREAELAAKRGKLLRKYVVIALVFFLVMLTLFGGLIIRIVDLKRAKDEAQANLDALQSQIEELQTTLDNVTSPEYIESQARSLLRMIYPNEVMYIVEDDSTE